jgi:hypothetical protein
MALYMPPSALEILAYSGYSFVGYCVSILCGWALGRGLGWHVAWLYTSACMSIFLIRTFKQMIRFDAAARGVAPGEASTHIACTVMSIASRIPHHLLA